MPLTTGVVLAEGDPLEKHLKSTRSDIIDRVVLFGEQGKRCRLLAVRVAPEVVAARHAERRKKARQSGKKPCPKGLVRDGWHLMLNNLTKDQASVVQLGAIYRARRAVEIQFRAWKQALNLGKALNRKSSEHHMQALVLAAMIAHQLGMKIAQQIGGEIGRAIRTPPRTILQGRICAPRKALGRGSRHLDNPPVDPYLQAMKTTIELPDVLARKAKLLAAERQTTLRALVVQGLEQVIAEKHITAKDRAKKLFAAMDRTSGIAAGKRLSRAESHAR